MPSPFPGMDPYLERHWGDLHAELISLARTALNGVLPPDLVARMEERVVVDRVDMDRLRVIYPDVHVYEDPAGRSGATQATAAGPAVAEPIVLEYDVEEHTETYLTIIDADGGELVTVIEVLSPGNKLPGDARSQYRRKRDELEQAKVNLVEIDLIRRGSWRELLTPLVPPARVESAYRVITRRHHPRRRAELYPISLRQRLPIIPIPLRANDADVTLDLQSLLERAYENGRYDRTRYDQPLDPPLDPEDAEWAEQLIKAAGRQ